MLAWGVAFVTDEEGLGGGVAGVTDSLFLIDLVRNIGHRMIYGSMRGIVGLVVHVDRARPNGMGNFCGGLGRSLGGRVGIITSRLTGTAGTWSLEGRGDCL